jgi:hypothetical protein
MSEDISKEPARPPRPEPPADEPDDRSLDYGEEPPFPRTIRGAGAILIVLGSLVLLNVLLTLVLSFLLPRNVWGQEGACAVVYGLGGICVALGVTLIGWVFIQQGVRAVRGTLRDTRGTGIASIAFGVLILGAAGITLVTGAVIHGGLTELVDVMLVTALQSGFAGLVGAMLVTAGVLALVGRGEYKRWQQWRKA